MKDQKTEIIHHFAQEFGLEDLKHETEADSSHHNENRMTIDSRFAMLKKKIADLSTRIEKLEKIIESKF